MSDKTKIEELRELVEKERAERTLKVREGIEILLNENKCKLETILVIKESGTQFILNIIPLE
jgi:hypothetical protein